MSEIVPTNYPQYVPVNSVVVEHGPATTPVASVVPQTSNYVSVFDDPSRFEHCMRMAEILSKSLFVPGGSKTDPSASFRGNPANCLIALDLAGRLNLAPTSLFPHLYVINGRPALSAQFVIALVNRSGKFSRIQWEEGADGEVSFEVYGKMRTVPNYWAEARFTELASGTEYRSTRVSVEIARRSGWLTKDGSKWQTLPKEMCRWRSAAWLAKNYAPELVLGLDFEDELRDAEVDAKPFTKVVSSARTISVEPLEEDVIEDVKTVESVLNDEIKNARSLKELVAVGEKVAQTDLDREQKNKLREAFLNRRQELTEATQEAQEPEPEPEPKPKRTRRTKKTEPAPESGNLLIDAIRAAKTTEELRSVQQAINDSVSNGEVDEKEVENLNAAIEGRALELGEAAEASVPTDRQKSNFDFLSQDIRDAETMESLQNVYEAVRDADSRGLITTEQRDRLFHDIDAKAVAFGSEN